MSNNVAVIIPARLAATRLPNKPLLRVDGKSMIEWVYRLVSTLTPYDVYVAAGDQEISDEVKSFNGRVILTDPNIPTGTDRINAALDLIDPEGNKYNTLVNYQGDAINTDPRIISDLVQLMDLVSADITTCGMLMNPAYYNDTSAVKIVSSIKPNESQGRCLYFSRQNVPFDREDPQKEKYHHVGIYVFKTEALKRFVSLPEGVLEKREKLEQLRALENGMSVYFKLVKKLVLIDNLPPDIDTPEDAKLIQSNFNLQELNQRGIFL